MSHKDEYDIANATVIVIPVDPMSERMDSHCLFHSKINKFKKSLAVKTYMNILKNLT